MISAHTTRVIYVDGGLYTRGFRRWVYIACRVIRAPGVYSMESYMRARCVIWITFERILSRALSHILLRDVACWIDDAVLNPAMLTRALTKSCLSVCRPVGAGREILEGGVRAYHGAAIIPCRIQEPSICWNCLAKRSRYYVTRSEPCTPASVMRDVGSMKAVPDEAIFV